MHIIFMLIIHRQNNKTLVLFSYQHYSLCIISLELLIFSNYQNL